MPERAVPALESASANAVPRLQQKLRDSPEEIFERRLIDMVRPGDRVLDVGCGAGKYFRADFASRVSCRWIGVDTHPDIARNERLHSRARGNATEMPFAGHSFDVVICRWMIEHVGQPRAAFSEFARILKPSGRLALFTPNLLHYYGMTAKLTPYWFHRWFNRRVRGFDATDVFPTLYHANTRRRLRRLLDETGFTKIDVTLEEGAPACLEFNPLLHGCGKIYEHLVTRYACLSVFRMNLIAVAVKP